MDRNHATQLTANCSARCICIGGMQSSSTVAVALRKRSVNISAARYDQEVVGTVGSRWTCSRGVVSIATETKGYRTSNSWSASCETNSRRRLSITVTFRFFYRSIGAICCFRTYLVGNDFSAEANVIILTGELTNWGVCNYRCDVCVVERTDATSTSSEILKTIVRR